MGREVGGGGVVEVYVCVEEDEDTAVNVVGLLGGWGVDPPGVPGAGWVRLSEDGLPVGAVSVCCGGTKGVVETEVWLWGVGEVTVNWRCPVNCVEEGEDEEVVLQGWVIWTEGVDEALEMNFIAVHVFTISCV